MRKQDRDELAEAALLLGGLVVFSSLLGFRAPPAGSHVPPVMFDPTQTNVGITLSGNNLIGTKNGVNDNTGRTYATKGVSAGKAYWELEILAIQLASGGTAFGMGLDVAGQSLAAAVGYSSGWGVWCSSNNPVTTPTTTAFHTAPTDWPLNPWQLVGQRAGCAWDAGAGDLWFSIDGAYLGGGDPDTGTDPTYTGVLGTLFPVFCPWYQLGGIFNSGEAFFTAGGMLHRPATFAAWADA